VALLHTASEVGAPCRNTTTSWSLGIASGSASFEGLAGEVAIHSAGLVDAPCVHAAAPRALGSAGSRDGASKGVAGDVAATASERLLHIQAATLLVMEEREERGCWRARRPSRRRGQGGHAGAAAYGAADETGREARSVSIDWFLEWVPPFWGGGEIPSIEGMERDF
jgi:hypothetical protein